ncbi:hypothetical protein ABK040_013784 [Willaertia magna]
MGTHIQLVVARDKNAVKEVLVRKYKSISKGQQLAPVGIFGPNMFSADSNDPLWKKHRIIANPIFSSNAHLKNVFRVTLEECKKIGNFWNKENLYERIEENGGVSYKKVNVTNEFKSITLTVINRVAFDYDMDIFGKDVKHRDELHDWVNNLLFGLILHFVFPGWFFDYVPFGPFKRFKDSKEKFRQNALTMIDKKMKELKGSNSELSQDEDLLTLLLNAGVLNVENESDRLSVDELLSAIFIIFFAGFETSSTSLNFMFRLLATHPDVQQRIHDEIDQEIESIDDLTYEIVTEKLPYTTSFIKEALRVKTPVPGSSRIAHKNETISGIPIPKGTLVNVNVISQHYYALDGKDEFKPDRFLVNNNSNTDKNDNNEVDSKYESSNPMGNLSIDFLKEEIAPFSIGPRDCVGKRMALLEIKTILIFFLKQFKLVVPADIEKEQNEIKETYIITRTTDKPYLIDFIKRK